MLYPKPQINQSLNPQEYSHKVIVAGTRGYNDRVRFHETIVHYLDELTEPVLFISGAAPSGADRLIIQWCSKFKYPCLEFPANWDWSRGAGFIRNAEMGQFGSELIAFYDGVSPGTTHMISVANRQNLPIKIIRI